MNNIPFSKSLTALGEYFVLIVSVFWVSIRRPPSFSLIRNQLYEIGVASLPVISITGFSTGIVLAAQAYFQLSGYGLTSVTGLMVAKAMMVEMGPVLTAFMITGRVGASMTAELGTMRVTEQIDALKSMAVNPLRYLVAPRFIGGIVMLPLLTIYSCFMGIVGGYMIAVHYYGMDPQTFLDPLPVHLDNFDLFSGILKSIFFGIVIVTISCYKGMTSHGGAKGVGRSTTNSVVICYSVILITNFLITIGINSFYPFLEKYLPWMVK
ncbi:MAG: putative phospholipid ABC transporter permease protein MlaE [Chlamydiae bacterium]|nr:putative phospholipid ABC transporter permease protein MlaE [Chlamydiota bacterium]